MHIHINPRCCQNNPGGLLDVHCQLGGMWLCKNSRRASETSTLKYYSLKFSKMMLISIIPRLPLSAGALIQSIYKTPSPTATSMGLQPLSSPTSGGMSVASTVLPTSSSNVYSMLRRLEIGVSGTVSPS